MNLKRFINPLIHPSTSQIQHSWDHGKISVSNISFFTSRCLPVTRAAQSHENQRTFAVHEAQYPLCSVFAKWCNSPPEGQGSYALGDPFRSWFWTQTAPHNLWLVKGKNTSACWVGVWVVLCCSTVPLVQRSAFGQSLQNIPKLWSQCHHCNNPFLIAFFPVPQ